MDTSETSSPEIDSRLSIIKQFLCNGLSIIKQFFCDGFLPLIGTLLILIFRWGIFSVLLPLAPIFLHYYESNSSESLNQILSEDGEILIISVVLCGEGLREALTSPTDKSKLFEFLRQLLGPSAFILSVAACLLFKDLAKEDHSAIIDALAVKIFTASLAVSAFCQLFKFSERQRNE